MIRLALKLRRIALGLRQQDIAANVGMSTTRYSAIERGEIDPRPDEIVELRRILEKPREEADGVSEAVRAALAELRRRVKP